MRNVEQMSWDTMRIRLRPVYSQVREIFFILKNRYTMEDAMRTIESERRGEWHKDTEDGRGFEERHDRRRPTENRVDF